jgi:hypothetical protein
MAAAYGHPLFLALPSQKPKLIYHNCNESFIFNQKENKIYFQIWKRTDVGNLFSFLAIYDIKTKKLEYLKENFLD